jgi:DNA-binding LytR/AlgR family response regulator
MILRCLIVDDEPMARQGMREYIQETAFLQCYAEASNAAEAVLALQKGNIDIMLLDIQMPAQSGLDLLRSLKTKPLVIFTTAFSEFALDGFELDVVDYLVKPIPYNRFLKAATKARDIWALQQAGEKPAAVAPYFFVKSNGRFERILFQEVCWVEGMQNYVMIHTTTKKFMVYMTMTAMEAQLQPNEFMRVHKSFIVGLRHVQSIEGHELTVAHAHVPISRNLLEAVRARVLGNSWVRR